MEKLFILLCVYLTNVSFSQNWFQDKDKIEQIVYTKGTWFEKEGIFKITVPRTNVKMTVKDLAKEIQSALEAIGSKFEKNQII